MLLSSHNSASRMVLSKEIDEFLIDREAQKLTSSTIRWYHDSLRIFHDYLADQGIDQTVDVSPGTLRRFILFLSDRGHSDGGVVNIFGAVKAYLNWYVAEYAPDGWENPLQRVKAPRRPKEVLPPFDHDDGANALP